MKKVALTVAVLTLGLAATAVTRPHYIHKDTLVLREGTHFEVRVPLAAVATVQAARAVAAGEADVAFAAVRPPGHHAVTLPSAQRVYRSGGEPETMSRWERTPAGIGGGSGVSSHVLSGRRRRRP